MEHHIVWSEPGHFAGWPANHGIWIWEDDEILVGFAVGSYRVQSGHHIEEPIRNVFARSLDGGQRWQLELPSGYSAEVADLVPLPEALDFQAPGLALRVIGTGYHGSAEPRGGIFCSTDRGHSWQGPYTLSGLADSGPLAGLELTPRTDYLVEDAQRCQLFLSARPPDLWGGDRVCVLHSEDGGRSFQFGAWIVPPADPHRAVMPSTVRVGAQQLVSAIRRRDMSGGPCWIDAYGSADSGRSWHFLSRIGQTGDQNGNPPALLRLQDGRLCCVYGRRDRRQLVARYSRDGGSRWEAEFVLRDGYSSGHDDADLGYPRLVQRADGRLLAVYYWATRERPHQHIAATLWDPSS